ncbi:uncharacterized protein LOC144744290 [Ciona intestinalis]
MTNRESQQFYSYSTKSSIKAKIGYRMCLSSVPSYVYATVKATESSLPHTFNVTVLDVKESYFEVELKRTDISEGWNMFVTVDWFFYIGNAVVYGNNVIWITDLFNSKSMNYTTAKTDCKDKGGKLVEIVDKPMYDVVYNYVRSNFVFGTKGAASFYLGSTYDPEADNVTQSNGEPGYNGNWNPGKWPVNDSGRQNLAVRVAFDLSLTNNGMRNVKPTNLRRSAIQICCMEIPAVITEIGIPNKLL